MPTVKQRIAFKEVVVNGGTLVKAMKIAKYSPSAVKRTDKLTGTKGWKELMENTLSDKLITKRHLELLNSTRLDHMVFPLDDESLTDEEIGELLKSVNCTLRKIVYGETARHVYFWSPDNKARKDAIDMAYKVKGRYPKEGGGVTAVQVNLGEMRKEFQV